MTMCAKCLLFTWHYPDAAPSLFTLRQKPMNTLQDRFWLIIAGFIAAGAAWAFWRFTGAWGGDILLVMTVISLSVEVRRLRKQIAQLKPDNGS